jgi:hypothetical protein
MIGKTLVISAMKERPAQQITGLDFVKTCPVKARGIRILQKWRHSNCTNFNIYSFSLFHLISKIFFSTQHILEKNRYFFL